MKFTRVIAMFLMGALMLGCMAACGGVNYAETNTEYVIGVSGPLTGGAAMYGVAVANAAQMAVGRVCDVEVDVHGWSCA